MEWVDRSELSGCCPGVYKDRLSPASPQEPAAEPGSWSLDPEPKGGGKEPAARRESCAASERRGLARNWLRRGRVRRVAPRGGGAGGGIRKFPGNSFPSRHSPPPPQVPTSPDPGKQKMKCFQVSLASVPQPLAVVGLWSAWERRTPQRRVPGLPAGWERVQCPGGSSWGSRAAAAPVPELGGGVPQLRSRSA